MKLILILLGTFYVNAALCREDETDESDGSGTEEVKDEKTKDFTSDIMSKIAYLLEENLNKRNAFLEETINKKSAFLEETIRKDIDSLRKELTKVGSGESQTCVRANTALPEIPTGTVNALITKFEAQVDEAKELISKVSTELKLDISNGPLSADEKLIQKTQVNKNENKINKGLEGGKIGFKRIATEAWEVKKAADTETKLKVLEILAEGEDDPKTSKIEKLGTVIGAITKGYAQFKVIMDPKKTWQERTAAGFTVASDLVSFLPPPFGATGSAIFSLLGACFGVAAPTTNEYSKLRDQILSGIKNLLDAQQRAETRGCLYQIEFLGGILEMHTGDEDGDHDEDDADVSKLMTKDEFFAVILAGGIDIGVATLGTLKDKMETYRDENTIVAGRRALDMAHYYVLIAEQRDMLTRQILSYIKVSGGSGFTARFFENTKKLAHRDYQNLFFWEDTCCQKNDKYFSALLAYNLPLKKHAGAKNAVAVVSEFIKQCRTTAYYDDVYNSVNKETALSYDTPKAVTGNSAEVMYTMVERPVDNAYYKYRSYATSANYLGQGNYRIGQEQHNTNWYKDNCDDSYNPITRFGVSSRTSNWQGWHHYSRLKIQFEESADAGEPRAADVSLKKSNGDLFFITKGLNLKNKDPNGKYTKFAYADYDMLVSCVNGKSEYGKSALTPEKMRLFKVKLSTWLYPKFLISPLAKDSGKDQIYFLMKDSYYNHINNLNTPPGTGVQILPTDAVALTPEILIRPDSMWASLWFKKDPIGDGEGITITETGALRCKGVNDNCCTSEEPCVRGDGDCDEHNQCVGSLRCQDNTCPWGDGDDCCG